MSKLVQVLVPTNAFNGVLSDLTQTNLYAAVDSVYNVINATNAVAVVSAGKNVYTIIFKQSTFATDIVSYTNDLVSRVG